MQQPDADGIIKRTLLGVEEDLDDMRDALIDALEDYERALSALASSIPLWAGVDAKTVRQAWKLDQPPLVNSILGPRAVASVASEVETFVKKWLGTHQTPKVKALIEDDAHYLSYKEQYNALENLMASALQVSKEHTEEIQHELGVLGEEILLDLDDQRENNRKALEELIATGDVEQGNSAREELAGLWEEQREAAQSFEQTWQELSDHLVLGLELTQQGIETLRQMAQQVQESVNQAVVDLKQRVVPALEEPSEPKGDLFDPYGGQSEAPPQEEASTPRQTGRTKLLAQAKRKQKLETFFEEPEQENDDLVFEDQSPDPMIDFFEEEADEADSITAPLLFTPEEEEQVPAASSSPSRSPYDVFLSEESSDALPEDTAPSIPSPSPRPLSILPADFFVEEEVYTRDTDPALLGPTGKDAAEMPEVPPLVEDSPAVDDASFKTAPMGQWQEDVSEPVEDSSPEETQPTQPYLTTPEEVSEADVVEVPAQAPVTPPAQKPQPPTPEEHRGKEEDTSAEPVGVPSEEEETSEPVAEPALVEEPPLKQGALTKPEQEKRSGALSVKQSTPITSPETRLPTRGLAHRVRVGWAPLPKMEILVAQVLPMLLLGILLLVSALSDPQAFYYPLRTGSIPHVLSWLLWLWLLLGPWVLRWRMTWLGWKPVLLKRAQIHDEAQLILDAGQEGIAELGPWNLDRRALTEVSRSRWRSSHDETQGWLLTLVEENGRLWNFCTPEGELGRDWSFSSLPMTTTPDDTWSLKPEIYEALERWVDHATHL